MAEDLDRPQSAEPISSSNHPTNPTSSDAESQSPTPETSTDRKELFSRARTFLNSQQIVHQDIHAKRRFLLEKGLNETEVEALLHELPVQRPTIPPRSYPQPPPSNLPTLLLGLTRLFTWIAGGSLVLIYLYSRLLLPRILRTSTARHSIKSHHLSLWRKLKESLAELKHSKTESFSVLPRPEPFKEPPKYSACLTITDILNEVGGGSIDTNSVPPVTLLRCGISDFGKAKDGEPSQPSTEELFQYLEGQVPWLVSDEGLKYEQTLWETLSTCPFFVGTASPTPDVRHPEDQKPIHWEYTAPTPADPSPTLSSLTKLSASLPTTSTLRNNSRQHTLQALSEFTGYISTQVYMPYRPPMSAVGFLGTGTGGSLGLAEDEFRREIRALKGLVLNRRSFIPASPRSSQPSS